MSMTWEPALNFITTYELSACPADQACRREPAVASADLQVSISRIRLKLAGCSGLQRAACQAAKFACFSTGLGKLQQVSIPRVAQTWHF